MSALLVYEGEHTCRSKWMLENTLTLVMDSELVPSGTTGCYCSAGSFPCESHRELRGIPLCSFMLVKSGLERLKGRNERCTNGSGGISQFWLLHWFSLPLWLHKVLAQQQGWGPPQQQQYQWDAQYLQFMNKTENPTEALEIHFKYRARPCSNCEFQWMPSSPDKPGDFSGRIEPGKGATVVDESGNAVAISRVVFWAKGLTSGAIWDYTKEERLLVDPVTGIVKSDTNQRPTFTTNLKP